MGGDLRKMTSTHQDDRQSIPSLVTLHELPQRVLVLSDLHMGYGRDSDTRRYHRTENFFADDAFRRLLEYYDPDRAGPTLMVLNGDIFDFLRIASCPRTPQELSDWSADLEALGVTRTPGELKTSIVPKSASSASGHTTSNRCGSSSRSRVVIPVFSPVWDGG